MGASARYEVDPDDPRAPSEEVWAAMTPDERAEVLANLPSEFPVSEAAPPEGDPHMDAVIDARQVLRGHFGRIGRRVYVANNLPVYYPGERMFSPDVIAILDVDTHPREHWTVSAEGKGLDAVIEILWSGRRTKDLRDNVERYARLGIREYFVFDRKRLRIHGHVLGGSRAYQPIVPQGGRYRSDVLGLDLVLEGDRLRFLYGMAPLPDAAELIQRLDTMLGEVVAKREEAERRAEDEARRAEDEARRAGEEAHRADAAERRLAEALAELERLKR